MESQVAAKNNLRQILSDHNITLGTLAKRSGFSTRTISGVAEAKKKPSPKVYLDIFIGLNRILVELGARPLSFSDVFPNVELPRRRKLGRILTINFIKHAELAQKAGVVERTVSRAVHGESISARTAFQLLSGLNALLSERNVDRQYTISEVFPEFAYIEEEEE